MKVPFLDLPAQHAALQMELRAVCDRVFASCAFAGGPEVETFERAFAAYCGVAHCVGVGSGTAALELLLRAYDIGAGDEVIVPALTFFATAEAVSLAGATPVFVDVDGATGLIDVQQLASAVTSRTKAIIPVHLYGQPADLASVRAFAARHALVVIEDACQAHGARRAGQRAGAMAHAGAFSFYPGKNLGACGEAGAVTTDDAAIAAAVRMLRDHGSLRKYEHERVGRNDRMDGLQAGFLCVKLAHLDAWNQRRRVLAARYRARLDGLPGLTLLREDDGAESVYHLFAVRVPRRDHVQRRCTDAGVGTIIHYPVPVHLQAAYRRVETGGVRLPVSEAFAQETLSLPMYPELADAQVDHVAEVLRGVCA